MTLRIFGRPSRRASTPPEKAASQQAAAQPEPAARPARRRRGGARATGRSQQPPKPATEETKAPPATTAPSGRSRRGRRGGAARKASPPEAGAEAPRLRRAPEPAPAIPPRAETRTLEALLAQQEAQVAVLKGLQGTLSALENRLAGMERRETTVDRARVGIFVDVPNVMYAAERLKVKLDFKKVLDFLVRGRELVRASAYAPISDDPQARLETQKFVQPFVDLGYRVVTKPHKRYADGSLKANFDVELAIDVLTMSDRLDIVTLVSGDGDFRRLVELVESKGVRVEVVAFGQSMAAELRAVADESIDLNDHIVELRVQ